MEPKRQGGREVARRRRRVTSTVQQALRDLGTQLSLLNYRIGGNVELRNVDLLCLDVVDQDGPLSPSALARRAGLHPATMTGVLDRLERGRWIVRERDPADRRGVAVRVLRERSAELFHLYAGMRTELNGICADYSEEELATVADFLARVAAAGRESADRLPRG
ncbi:MAG TPA: MarR family transcriptional regulator [Actinopolymorphaceae bacterium]|jgi:DNA-binding MarR family transcriptional regulator|nr:MarR family transcriptional regulator [Actinopolymorphaceae bacterium]